MELPELAAVAAQIFEMLPVERWEGKSAEELEAGVQQIVNQLGAYLLMEHLLPARIQELEQKIEVGQLRCRQCGRRLQVHRRGAVIHPQTIFGQRGELRRTQYYCPECESYEVVADRALGFLDRQLTPRLAVVTALCGASWSYPVAAAFLEFLLQVKLCAKSVANLTRDARLLPAPLAPDPLDQPPGVVQMDGVVVRGRKKDAWLEMKVGAFYSQVVEVSPTRREILDASFVGSACQQWQEFEAPVTREAARRGLDCSEAVEFVADGGRGIWSLQETVFPHARTRLDQFHLKCKVSERSAQIWPQAQVQEQRQADLQAQLERGEVAAALAYLRGHQPKRLEREQAHEKLLKYLERHEHHIPDYEQVRAAGGTVSSGLGEKANDLVVVRRMKQDLMHWTREGADPIIQHRTAFINQHARARCGPYDLAFCQHFNQ